jgi:hypothetical protein
MLHLQDLFFAFDSRMISSTELEPMWLCSAFPYLKLTFLIFALRDQKNHVRPKSAGPVSIHVTWNWELRIWKEKCLQLCHVVRAWFEIWQNINKSVNCFEKFTLHVYLNIWTYNVKKYTLRMKSFVSDCSRCWKIALVARLYVHNPL